MANFDKPLPDFSNQDNTATSTGSPFDKPLPNFTDPNSLLGKVETHARGAWNDVKQFTGELAKPIVEGGKDLLHGDIAGAASVALNQSNRNVATILKGTSDIVTGVPMTAMKFPNVLSHVPVIKEHIIDPQMNFVKNIRKTVDDYMDTQVKKAGGEDAGTTLASMAPAGAAIALLGAAGVEVDAPEGAGMVAKILSRAATGALQFGGAGLIKSGGDYLTAAKDAVAGALMEPLFGAFGDTVGAAKGYLGKVQDARAYTAFTEKYGADGVKLSNKFHELGIDDPILMAKQIHKISDLIRSGELNVKTVDEFVNKIGIENKQIINEQNAQTAATAQAEQARNIETQRVNGILAGQAGGDTPTGGNPLVPENMPTMPTAQQPQSPELSISDLILRSQPGATGQANTPYVDESAGGTISKPTVTVPDRGGIPSSKLFKHDANGNAIGATSVADDKLIIELVKNDPDATASTFYHEIGHVWRKLLRPDLLKGAEDFYGVENGDWANNVQAEERFANDYENRIRGVKTGNPKVDGAIKAFGAWMDENKNVVSGAQHSVINAVVNAATGKESEPTPAVAAPVNGSEVQYGDIRNSFRDLDNTPTKPSTISQAFDTTKDVASHPVEGFKNFLGFIDREFRSEGSVLGAGMDRVANEFVNLPVGANGAGYLALRKATEPTVGIDAVVDGYKMSANDFGSKMATASRVQQALDRGIPMQEDAVKLIEWVKDRAASLSKVHPEFVKAATTAMNNLGAGYSDALDMLDGVISKADKENMQAVGQYNAALYRYKPDESGQLESARTGGRRGQLPKQLRGGDAPIMDARLGLMKQTAMYFKAAKYHQFMADMWSKGTKEGWVTDTIDGLPQQALKGGYDATFKLLSDEYNGVLKPEAIRKLSGKVEQVNRILQPSRNLEPNEFAFKSAGKWITFKVNNPAIADFLKQQHNTIPDDAILRFADQLGRGGADIMRVGIVAHPTFFLRVFAKDIWNHFVIRDTISPIPGLTQYDQAKATYGIMNMAYKAIFKGQEFQDFLAKLHTEGASLGTLGEAPGEIEYQLKKMEAGKSVAARAKVSLDYYTHHPIKFIEDMPWITHLITRMAAAQSSIDAAAAQGLSEQEATRAGAEAFDNVSGNFSEKGKITRFVNRYVPFTTASISGDYAYFRALAKNPTAILSKTAQSIILPVTLSYAAYNGKDWYQKLDNYSKYRYLWLNEHTRIPLPMGVVGTIGSMWGSILDKHYHDSPEATGAILQNWSEGMPFQTFPLPPVATAALGVKENKNPFFGTSLDMGSQMDKNPADRTSTSPSAKWLSKKFSGVTNPLGLSPNALSFVNTSMGGTMATSAQKGLDTLINMSQGIAQPTQSGMKKIPVANIFYSDSPMEQNFGSNVEKFWSYYASAKNADSKDTNDQSLTKEEQFMLDRFDNLDDARSDAYDLMAQWKDVRDSKTMTGDQKTVQMKILARQFNSKINAANAEFEKAWSSQGKPKIPKYYGRQ